MLFKPTNISFILHIIKEHKHAEIEIKTFGSVLVNGLGFRLSIISNCDNQHDQMIAKLNNNLTTV